MSDEYSASESGLPFVKALAAYAGFALHATGVALCIGASHASHPAVVFALALFAGLAHMQGSYFVSRKW